MDKAFFFAFSSNLSLDRDEIGVIRRTCYYRAFNFSFFFTASKFVLLVILVPFILIQVQYYRRTSVLLYSNVLLNFLLAHFRAAW